MSENLKSSFSLLQFLPKTNKKFVIISALACKIGQIKLFFFGFLEELKPRKIASDNFGDFLTFTVLLFSVAFTSTCYV